MNSRYKKHRTVVTFVFGLLSLYANAGIGLPKVIGDNMVLQRNKAVAIWGTASAGEEITVRFKQQTKKTIADNSGNWRVNLTAMAASNKASAMMIFGAGDTIRLANILVGEVWLCSGQSNMEYTMMKETKFSDAQRSKGIDSVQLKDENFPGIRLFLVKRNLLKAGDVNEGWKEANGEPLKAFSAVGYFFAKKLYQELHVPIGIISSAVPGSAIDPWLPGAPRETGDSFELDQRQPGKFYKGWIQPLAPFTLQGFLWYQGETNCFLNETTSYSKKFVQLIRNWRSLWNNSEAAFYFVQIAPFYYSRSKGKVELDEQTLPRFWRAQQAALSEPHTGMVVTTDLVDNLNDLHPTYKWKVGERLALLALAGNYQQNITCSGPKIRKARIDGDRVKLEFTNASKGLVREDQQPLTWFEVAGTNEKFVPATAVIRNNTVVVSAEGIKSPKYVRFGWNEVAQPNLYNKEGLPAVPFSTDENDWTKRIHNAF
jgi:sialate O-acetylesterase